MDMTHEDNVERSAWELEFVRNDYKNITNAVLDFLDRYKGKEPVTNIKCSGNAAIEEAFRRC